MSLTNEMSCSSYVSYISANSNLKKEVYPLKICLLGDVAVGKTSLFYMFGDGVFTDKHNPTMNCQFKIKEISIGPKTSAELKVWDTCGEEKFRSITQQYYKEADGIVLIFDLSNITTFNNLETWLGNIKNFCKKETEVFLVGNKMDLVNKKEINDEQINDFSDKHKLRYIPISAKDGTNVTLVFEELADKCVKIITTGQSESDENTEKSKEFNLGVGVASFGHPRSRPDITGQKKKEIICC